MQSKVHLNQLFRNFTRINDYLCEIYQDFTYLSYVRDEDVNGSKKCILNDVDGIQKQTSDLCQSAAEDGLFLDSTGIDNAIQNIRNELQQINTLTDIEKRMVYQQGIFIENKLIDGLAYKLHTAVSQFYDQLCEPLRNQTLYPFWEKFPETLTYYQVTENPQSAIQQAFTLFEDHLRKRINAGPDLFGEELINKAFGKNGILIYSTIPAEQNGVRNLFSGVYATFRNPNMHRITKSDEKSALSILALIYTMIDVVDKSEIA